MSTQNTSKYTFILISSMVLLLSSVGVFAQNVADTATVDSTDQKIKKIDSAGHQLTLGVDLVTPVTNYFNSDQYGYEFVADYYLRNEFYFVAEGGWGGSTVSYSDLSYNTKNDFIRLGFNKALLPRDNKKDWDMMMFGLRVGAANVTRSNANFTIVDSLWGNTNGQDTGKKFAAVWAELVLGMRVELLKNVFAGWNLRGKFMLDGKSFNDLSPQYIAGFGRGDKNTSFTFNVYVNYAIRWKRNFKSPPVTVVPAKP